MYMVTVQEYFLLNIDCKGFYPPASGSIRGLLSLVGFRKELERGEKKIALLITRVTVGMVNGV